VNGVNGVKLVKEVNGGKRKSGKAEKRKRVKE